MVVLGDGSDAHVDAVILGIGSDDRISALHERIEVFFCSTIDSPMPMVFSVVERTIWSKRSVEMRGSTCSSSPSLTSREVLQASLR